MLITAKQDSGERLLSGPTNAYEHINVQHVSIVPFTQIYDEQNNKKAHT